MGHQSAGHRPHAHPGAGRRASPMAGPQGHFDPDTLQRALAQLASLPVANPLQHLVQAGLADLPQPGAGATLQRWRALSRVARHSLPLAKLYEGHVDALAILRELRCAPTGGHGTWATWAAEAPGQRVCVQPKGASHGQVTLTGSKAWCSGAHGASHALLTAWWPDGEQPQLVAVALDHASIGRDTLAWCAVGMAETLSADVTFDGTPATLVGQPGDYLRRPGFWHGGAGIAACWYGGALAIADALHASLRGLAPSHPAYPYRASAFGKVDRVLAGVAALLQASAAWIDTHPRADAMAIALRVRQAAEAAATCVLEETGRVLGATPYCRDTAFAHAAADLPVFIRQSHGARDDAALASAVLAQEGDPWAL